MKIYFKVWSDFCKFEEKVVLEVDDNTTEKALYKMAEDLAKANIEEYYYIRNGIYSKPTKRTYEMYLKESSYEVHKATQEEIEKYEFKDVDLTEEEWNNIIALIKEEEL